MKTELVHSREEQFTNSMRCYSDFQRQFFFTFLPWLGTILFSHHAYDNILMLTPSLGWALSLASRAKLFACAIYLVLSTMWEGGCCYYPYIYRKENRGSQRLTVLLKIIVTPGTSALSLRRGCLLMHELLSYLCFAFDAPRTRACTGSGCGVNVCIPTHLRFPTWKPVSHL